MEAFDHHEFAKIKAKAETLYKTVVKVRCPALAADVHFSSDGFHHLQFNGVRVERLKTVQNQDALHPRSGRSYQKDDNDSGISDRPPAYRQNGQKWFSANETRRILCFPCHYRLDQAAPRQRRGSSGR